MCVCVCFVENEGNEVKFGTACKNGGCTKVLHTYTHTPSSYIYGLTIIKDFEILCVCVLQTFSGPASDEDMCLFHPGVPIFHEIETHTHTFYGTSIK